MCVENPSRRVHTGFCDGDYPSNAHMCLIYKNEEDRRSLILKFAVKEFKN